MDIQGKVVVVTGGASGIGRALCEAFRTAGAAAIAVADMDRQGAEATAASLGGLAFACDVSREGDIANLVEAVERQAGPIDLFCSNAGVAVNDPSPEDVTSAPNALWEKSWAINVMAHVYAARALLPRMIERGGGYFLQTISAAGLLTQPEGAVYATTKHAAVGFAENLAIMHRRHGVRVSMLCPMGVETPLLRGMRSGPQHRARVLSPADVARAAVEGVAAERFLILPHDEVATFMQRKADDYDRWIAGMARMATG